MVYKMLKKKNDNDLNKLLETSRNMLELAKNNESFKISQLDNSPIYNEIIHNINSAFEILEKSQKDTTIRLQLVKEAIRVGLWEATIIDGSPVHPENKYYWSDDVRRMLGFNDEEDFPNTIASFSKQVHPDDRERFIKAAHTHMLDKSGRTPYDIELRMRLKTNEYRWFRANASTLRDKDGKALKVAGAIFDIHDEKVKKKEFQSLLNRFELVNEVLSEGSWCMDTSTNSKGDTEKEYWWSPQFRKLLGYNNEQDFPNDADSWINSLHPDDKSKTLGMFQAHLSDYTGNTPYELDYRLKSKNGEYRWYHATGLTYRDDKGAPIRVAGTIRDITIEINNQELEKEVNTRMEILSESITQMATAVNSITEQAQELTKSQEIATKTAYGAQNTANDTKNITDFIKGIADQTNLLGLNAAIESARAGEHGKGFAIVSEEIRKLADDSANAVVNIEKSLNDMEREVNQIIISCDDMNIITQSQAAMTEEINATIEEISSMAQELMKSTNKIK
ncbi:methyl-accepting chemotaxis protein [Anaeromicropila herbilytica]|uniref:Methyl-accepting chemotaxis protein n=1 Tax=Anaeromicropila herbilytica TaxID=2785025 RepID=A0A7R7ENT4_9FIRM|nr:PAS domain-containing protein [Anaeromicropila herbilytica]BCN32295.1 methyl-accepting chemotaxis protein [Anaeromicropila herbilytica]